MRRFSAHHAQASRPAGVEAAVLKALATLPACRFGTAALFGDALVKGRSNTAPHTRIGAQRVRFILQNHALAHDALIAPKPSLAITSEMA